MLFVFLEKNSILSKRNDHLHAMTYHCHLSSEKLCKHIHKRQNTGCQIYAVNFLCIMYLFCFHFSYGGTHHTFSYYFRLQCAILKQLKMLLMLLLQQCFLGYRFVFSLLFSSFTMTMMLQCGTFDVLCFIRYECAGSGLCFLAVCQYLCSNIYVYTVKLLQLANIYVFFSI